MDDYPSIIELGVCKLWQLSMKEVCISTALRALAEDQFALVKHARLSVDLTVCFAISATMTDKKKI